MPKFMIVSLKNVILAFFMMIFLFDCKESSEIDRVNQYLAAINAQEGNAPPSTQPVSLATLGGSNGKPEATGIVGGTPRVVKEGFCGDGIINGSTEDCDQGAIQNTTCREYNGISGTVRCQENCLYDISDCLTEKTNRELGGLAETCTCQCDNTDCQGGCSPLGVIGQSACEFDCRNDCVCQCQGKTTAHIDNCDFRCACINDLNGNPACRCSLDRCLLVTTIAPNIAYQVSVPSILAP